MIDHVSLPVRDLELSARFYDAVLAALGFVREATSDAAIGYARPDAEACGLWLLERRASGAADAGFGMHLGFRADSREEVDAFHAAALELGARSAGEPGPRPEYSPHFYGAFVFDPDGFKIEATTRSPPI